MTDNNNNTDSSTNNVVGIDSRWVTPDGKLTPNESIVDYLKAMTLLAEQGEVQSIIVCTGGMDHIYTSFMGGMALQYPQPCIGELNLVLSDLVVAAKFGYEHMFDDDDEGDV
jgi:hypothetical protein